MAQLVFEDDFELGDWCDWTSFAGRCFAEAELLAGLVGAHQVCLPVSAHSGVTICDEPCFLGGQGCLYTLNITQATYDAVTGFADLEASLDPFVAEVAFVFEGCDYVVSSGTVSALYGLGNEPLCGTATLRIASMVHILDMKTFSISGCELIDSLVGGLTTFFEAQLSDHVDTVLDDAVAQQATDAWICPP